MRSVSRRRGVLIMLVLCAGTVRPAMLPVAGDPVMTAQGQIAGTRLASGVRTYLGVPYAQPPVGDLRWAPPRPLRWSGVWNADRTAPECIQVLRPHAINHYFGEEASAEDCLYMNIWTPAATAGAKLPVIVFIYGGGGTVGSSGMALYGGENLAKRGAVFVNFNYRLGILGFLAHPALTREQGGHSGNYGYLDQVAALRWVHDNITAFGGDPAKVVIAGQSFGAGSVAAQIFSPLARGLFSGAAMWSACSFTDRAVPLATAEAVGVDVQSRLGAADLGALRDLPADKLLAIQEEHQVGANVQGVRLPPVIDGLFWVEDRLAALESRHFSDVPIIAGSNDEDIDVGRSPFNGVRTAAQFRQIAGQIYGADAAAFLRQFPAATDAEAQAAARRAAQEAGFLGQSVSCANLLQRHGRSPAFVELFAQRHSYEPGVRIADQDAATIGAYHTADVGFWLDTLDAFNVLRKTRRWTDDNRRLADLMAQSLVAFAATGNPSTRALYWPAWSMPDPRLVAFGEVPAASTVDAGRIDWLAAHRPAAATVNSRASRD